MAGKKSKSKGNNYEREVVGLLNELYNVDQFARTPGSGSLMGRTNWAKRVELNQNQKETLASDIIVPDFFPYSVECKWYADSPNHSSVMKGYDADLNKWLAECCFDAINLQLIPMLFFKTNRKGTFIAVPSILKSVLKYNSCTMYHDFMILSEEEFKNNKDSLIDPKKCLAFVSEIQTIISTSQHIQDNIKQFVTP